MQGRELTEWEELAGGYAVFCHCLYQPTKEKYFQRAEQWLQDERIKVYAAMEENSLLGMIVLCIQGQQAEIVGISVCPQERHRGIGSWLIEWAMQKYNLHRPMGRQSVFTGRLDLRPKKNGCSMERNPFCVTAACCTNRTQPKRDRRIFLLSRCFIPSSAHRYPPVRDRCVRPKPD